MAFILNELANIFLSDFKKDNNVYRDMMDAMEYKRYTYSTPSVGSEFLLGSATITATVGSYVAECLITVLSREVTISQTTATIDLDSGTIINNNFLLNL